MPAGMRNLSYNPAQVQCGDQWQFGMIGVIRYDLHSTVPVNTAVLDGAIYDSDHQVAWLMFQTAAMGTTIQGAPPNPIRCFSPSVIATQQSCEMGKEMMIIYLTSSANESGSAVTI